MKAFLLLIVTAVSSVVMAMGVDNNHLVRCLEPKNDEPVEVRIYQDAGTQFSLLVLRHNKLEGSTKFIMREPVGLDQNAQYVVFRNNRKGLKLAFDQTRAGLIKLQTGSAPIALVCTQRK